MAEPTSTNNPSKLEQTKPSAHGQGTSKAAMIRRRKAAEKKAKLSSAETIPPHDTEDASTASTKSVTTVSDASKTPTSTTSNNVMTITKDDLAASRETIRGSLPVKRNVTDISIPKRLSAKNNSFESYTNVVAPGNGFPSPSQRKMSFSSASSSSSGTGKKSRTRKIKPHVDADGWSTIPKAEKFRKDEMAVELSSSLKSLSPSVSPNPYEPLQGNSAGQVQNKVGIKSSKPRQKSKKGSLDIDTQQHAPSAPAVKTISGSRKVSGSYTSSGNVSASPLLSRKVSSSTPALPSKKTGAPAELVPTSSDFPVLFDKLQSPVHFLGMKRDHKSVQCWSKAAVSPPTGAEPNVQPSVSTEDSAAAATRDLPLIDKPQSSEEAVPPAALLSTTLSEKAPSIMPHMIPTQSFATPIPITPSFVTTGVSPQPKQLTGELRQTLHSQIVDQDLDNLLLMIRQQREALLDGPRITIRIGNETVEGVAKRAAMAASSTLHKHFTKYPESLEYRFSRGQVNPGAVGLLLIGWMEETCKEFEAYAVPFQTSLEEDVAVLRASRMLGMERYCKYILDEYVDYLKNCLPSYEEIVAIEQNFIHDKEPLWTAMVNHLCHERYRRLIPDIEEFQAFLEKHLRLKKAMESADKFFAGHARKIAEMKRRQRWEHNQAEKRERIEREHRTAESLQYKLSTRGPGLLTLTADEAEMLRARAY